MNTSGIVLATSIPSQIVRHDGGYEIGQEYQRRCVNSWIDAGFTVLSLNFHNEITQLASQYPMVHFISIESNASLEQRGPLLSELLQVLAKQDEAVVGIINGDILLIDPEQWAHIVKEATCNAMVVAHRADVTVLCGSTTTPYCSGYDLFFFERRHIPQEVTARPFAMGLPWWDYCLPVALIFRGIQTKLINYPVGLHLQHPTNYSWASWRYMAIEFAEFVLECATDTNAVPERLLPVITLCRKVVAEPRNFGDGQGSLTERAFAEALHIAAEIPFLRRYASGHHGRDANLHRLSQACTAAISASAL